MSPTIHTIPIINEHRTLSTIKSCVSDRVPARAPLQCCNRRWPLLRNFSFSTVALTRTCALGWPLRNIHLSSVTTHVCCHLLLSLGQTILWPAASGGRWNEARSPVIIVIASVRKCCQRRILTQMVLAGRSAFHYYDVFCNAMTMNIILSIMKGSVCLKGLLLSYTKLWFRSSDDDEVDRQLELMMSRRREEVHSVQLLDIYDIYNIYNICCI